MGLFRLFLACAVALAHAGTDWQPYFPFLSIVSNVHAVRMFFVISGFYMALVLETKYLAARHGVVLFYLNRLARLLPLYWIVATAFIVASYIVHPLSLTTNVGWWNNDAFKGHPWAFAYEIATNLLLVGQDIASFIPLNGSMRGHDYLIIPQAWSIGAEIWFYLAAPLLVRLRSRALWLIVAVGILIRIGLVLCDLPFWPWQQRLTLTEYIYFVLGILAYRAIDSATCQSILTSKWRPIMWIAPFLIVFYVGWLGIGRELDIFNSLLMTCLTAVIVPPLFLLSKNSRIDELAGDLSYPVYLVHFPVIYLLPEMIKMPYGNTVGLLSVVLSTSAFLMLAIERPVDALRHRLSSVALRQERVRAAAPSPQALRRRESHSQEAERAQI
jgi:peptidoglycan/LPS O-acetylase OafA/YrhL